MLLVAQNDTLQMQATTLEIQDRCLQASNALDADVAQGSLDALALIAL